MNQKDIKFTYEKVNYFNLLRSELVNEYHNMNYEQKFDFLLNNLHFSKDDNYDFYYKYNSQLNNEFRRIMGFSLKYRFMLFPKYEDDFNEEEMKFIENIFLKSDWISLINLFKEVKNNTDEFKNNKDTILKIIKIMIENHICYIK